MPAVQQELKLTVAQKKEMEAVDPIFFKKYQHVRRDVKDRAKAREAVTANVGANRQVVALARFAFIIGVRCDLERRLPRRP